MGTLDGCGGGGAYALDAVDGGLLGANMLGWVNGLGESAGRGEPP